MSPEVESVPSGLPTVSDLWQLLREPTQADFGALTTDKRLADDSPRRAKRAWNAAHSAPCEKSFDDDVYSDAVGRESEREPYRFGSSGAGARYARDLDDDAA
jgi:hypothetical protein